MQIYKMRSLRVGQYIGEVHSIREVPSKFEGSRSLSRLEAFFGIEGVDRPVRTWMDPDLDSQATFGRLVSALGFDPNEYKTEPLDKRDDRCVHTVEIINAYVIVGHSRLVSTSGVSWI